ncbi:MAG: carbonic anhydrase [Candidatus Erginobacter occultus]|nr:carbonic anhydrase [Candidatus Erginobacter occultus]
MKRSRKTGWNIWMFVGLAIIVSGIFAAAADAALTPEEALKKLAEGNKRYVAGKAAHPNQGQARRQETVAGQHPFASILACSDSREPVEIIFDQGIGDIFVVRVAGNVVDTIEIGSLEYGVAHLETPVVVVLGHTHCGAVAAAVKDAPVQGSIVPLVENIIPAVFAVREKNPKLAGADLLARVTEENIFLSIENLITRSSIIREKIKAGKLQVLGAVYDIETGRIDLLGAHPEQAQFLKAYVPIPESSLLAP